MLVLLHDDITNQHTTSLFTMLREKIEKIPRMKLVCESNTNPHVFMYELKSRKKTNVIKCLEPLKHSILLRDGKVAATSEHFINIFDMKAQTVSDVDLPEDMLLYRMVELENGNIACEEYENTIIIFNIAE